ncbi:MAG: threonylcarbamoyl-AMP synthase, partial [Methanophagales archaeon]|nr:threonylcarbamoyl-AMP synthase [Methanophagales archaeon]
MYYEINSELSLFAATATVRVATPQAIKEASAIIKRGGLVAFPTETVYGLGADALNAIAVARIFEVKNRPRFDPLIVHISDPSSIAMLTSSIDEKAERLIEKFFPGPLTLVLPKSEIVPEIVTAGLPTVAIRMPSHPVALALIKRAERPIAAPSANLFGYLSPTTPVHVKEQIGERVEMILDGGRSPIGIESTVVEIAGEDAFILRYGGLTVDEIVEIIGEVKISTSNRRRPHSPGQLPRHYSPRTTIRILKYKEREEILEGKRKRAGLLAFRRPEEKEDYAAVEVLSPDGDLKEAAANLFACLHRLDKAMLDIIYAEPVPEVGLGSAIMDRLYRAEGCNKSKSKSKNKSKSKTKLGSMLLPLILIIIFTLALTLTLTPEAGAVAKSSGNGVLYADADAGADASLLLITEIYANTATRNERDEYVAITNPTANPVNIEGWSITDTEGRMIFPFFEVVPGQTIYVTRNASAFVALWSTSTARTGEAIIPDFEYGTDSDPEVTQMQRDERAFALRNTGDEVILLDKSGRKVDIVVYGDSEYECESGEWRDEPLKKPGDGMIFIRKGLQDTNQCNDWLILPIGASYHTPEKFFSSGDGDAIA